jgi:hypothetical protein
VRGFALPVAPPNTFLWHMAFSPVFVGTATSFTFFSSLMTHMHDILKPELN